MNAGDLAHVLNLQAIAGRLICAVANNAQEADFAPVPPLRIRRAAADRRSRNQVGVQSIRRLEDRAMIRRCPRPQQTRARQRDDSGCHVVIAVVIGDCAVNGVGGRRQLQVDRVVQHKAWSGVRGCAIVDHRPARCRVVRGVDRRLNSAVVADQERNAGNVLVGQRRGAHRVRRHVAQRRGRARRKSAAASPAHGSRSSP